MDDAGRWHWRATLCGPDGVTLARFAVAVVVAFVALRPGDPARALLVALVAVGVASDVVDGWWARRRGQTSARGARLDSAADLALSAAMAIAVLVAVDLRASAWLWWTIGAITALRATVLAVTYARFRASSFAHTWANKAAGAAISLAVLHALATAELGGPLTALACAVAAVAAGDELIMAATAPAHDPDARWSGATGWRPARRAQVRPASYPDAEEEAPMLASIPAFSSYSVRDVIQARHFYGDMLGLDTSIEHGMLTVTLGSGARVLLYPKDDHEPASHTVLMFPTDDITGVVAWLRSRGVRFEHLPGVGDDGIMPASEWGPANAWFKDPSGNWLSVVGSQAS